MTPLLDRFIPQPDVRERFEIVIKAPPDLVFEVASNFDMQSLPLVRMIFWLRERLMHSGGHTPRKPQGILEETRQLGWGTASTMTPNANENYCFTRSRFASCGTTFELRV